jgi:hypothetical protein
MVNTTCWSLSPLGISYSGADSSVAVSGFSKILFNDPLSGLGKGIWMIKNASLVKEAVPLPGLRVMIVSDTGSASAGRGLSRHHRGSVCGMSEVTNQCSIPT